MAVKKMGKAITFFDIYKACFGWHIKGRDGIFFSEKSRFSDWSEIFPQLKSFLSDGELLDKLRSKLYAQMGKQEPWLLSHGLINEIDKQWRKCREECEKKRKEYYDKYHGVITELFTELFDKLRQESINKPILLRWEGSDLVYAYCKDSIYKFDRTGYSDEEMILQIMNLEDAERRKFERLKHQFNEAEKIEKEGHRPAIPEEARIAVWRRDEGKCVKCGSRENLEYDHIVPISKGGSNTVRNIELLCQKCNREKKDNIC